MTRQEELVSRAVYVPIPVNGKTYHMPFILFVDWSIQERIAFAEHLRNVRVVYSAGGARTLCSVDYQLTRDHSSLLRTFFSEHIGSTKALPCVVGERTGCQETRTAIRLAWLDNQIGMIDVRLEKFA